MVDDAGASENGIEPWPEFKNHGHTWKKRRTTCLETIQMHSDTPVAYGILIHSERICERIGKSSLAECSAEESGAESACMACMVQ